jgi:hypothetical protein
MKVVDIEEGGLMRQCSEIGRVVCGSPSCSASSSCVGRRETLVEQMGNALTLCVSQRTARISSRGTIA